ncbi:MAG: hypothetical protein Q4F21_06110 [Lachnospiraceae bacterium]|nr:hypothetical protein [Lachnospiraceae bacterium]
MLGFYFRRFIVSPLVPVSAFILFIGMVFDSRFLYGDTMLPGTLYLFQYISAVGSCSYFVPVVTVLTVCFVQYEITTKKAELFLLYRSTPKQYSISGILASAASGAVISFLAFIMFFIFCMIVGNEGDWVTYGNAGKTLVRLHELEGTWFERIYSLPVLYFREIFIFLCNGMICPVIAFTIFSFTGNQYVAAILPFIWREGSKYIWQKPELPEWMWIFDPSELTLRGVARYFPDSGLSYLLIYVVLIMLICGSITCYRMQRRRFYG